MCYKEFGQNSVKIGNSWYVGELMSNGNQCQARFVAEKIISMKVVFLFVWRLKDRAERHDLNHDFAIHSPFQEGREKGKE